jgi:hypothetical protein
LDLAVVVGDDPVHDREPEPAAFRKTPVERLEERVELLGGDPDPLVRAAAAWAPGSITPITGRSP